MQEFKQGDRVAALHEVGKENGSFAEYATAPDWTTFLIPQNMSYEAAATVPMAALTAAVHLYLGMKLPPPYDPISHTEPQNRVPLLIYGITSAVGAFAAKLARLSGIGPIIGVAGRSSEFAHELADHVVDYRKGEDEIVSSIESFFAREDLGTKVVNVFDAISEGGSLEAIARIIDVNKGVVNTVLPPILFAKDKENFKFPAGVKVFQSSIPQIQTSHKDFGYVWSRYLGRLFAEGRLTPHPYEVIPGGLSGILKGLQNLKDGKASAVKYVYRVEETGSAVGMLDETGREVSDLDQSTTASHPMRNFPLPSS